MRVTVRRSFRAGFRLFACVATQISKAHAREGKDRDMHIQHNCQERSSGDVMVAFEIPRHVNLCAVADENSPDSEESHDSLEDAARDEHEYLRGRLRDELKREPSEEEMNEWLRQHTEGY